MYASHVLRVAVGERNSKGEMALVERGEGTRYEYERRERSEVGGKKM